MSRSHCALALAAVLIVLSGCGEVREAARSTGRVADVAAETQFPPASEAAEEVEPPTDFNTETYDHVQDNPFLVAARNPLSTFSIDVDTASYSNVRRFLSHGQMPPAGAVRIEELINYFAYDYPAPDGDIPFAVNIEVASCPWRPEHRLVRIGLKGREIPLEHRPSSNLVFLVDVSGSMRDANKLPLVQSALRLLVEQLGENDRVALVVYAGASGLVLSPTPADRKGAILSAIDNLQAGGSTNGGEGLRLAYDTALAGFVPGGTNRVILCTDGDFNVGLTNQSELIELIQSKARGGVFLSVLGFGMGNYKDSTMEKLADKGNGNYAYIDTLSEARKVLIEQMSGTLLTIAKDVKIQVDFNPLQVAGYRLIGYENRMLRAEDFRDDAKDAGEIGAGHTVTALYEIVPPHRSVPGAEVEPSRYLEEAQPSKAAAGDELLTVRLRYKEPDADNSRQFDVPVTDSGREFRDASDDFRFASAVAQFGMLLRNSPHKGDASYEAVLEHASQALGHDRMGYRQEFLQLVRRARELSGSVQTAGSPAQSRRPG